MTPLPSPPTDPPSPRDTDKPSPVPLLGGDPAADATQEARLVVLGMTCASCVRHVEEALLRHPGVTSATVDLAGSRATVVFDDQRSSVDALAEAVREEGYEVPTFTLRAREGKAPTVSSASSAPASASGGDSKTASTEPAAASGNGANEIDEHEAFVVERAVEEEQRELRRDLVLAATLTLPLLVLAMSHGTIEWAMSTAGRWTQGILATLVLVGPGRRFFRLAVRATLRRTADMNTLVALGASASFGYSAVALLAPAWLASAGASHAPAGAHVHGSAPALYFEAAGSIITFLLLGKWLESRAKQHLGDAVRGLLALRPKTARRVPRGGEDSEAQEIPLTDVRVGDWLHILPGERAPVDGRVVRGSAHVDESLLTGESLPIDKQIDDMVVGGSQNLDGSLTIGATRVGRDGAIARIIEAVESARGSRPPIAALADRVSAVFVPVVLLLATLTFAGWFAIDPTRAGAGFALERMVAVLVIACPCALGLATPAALAVATGRGAELGILLRGGAALESASRVTHVFLDKTGTVTEGKPTLTHIESWPPTSDLDDSALRLAASLESGSEHLLGRAVVQRARGEGLALSPVEQTRVTAGAGIEGVVDGKKVRVGTVAFVLSAAASDETNTRLLAEERARELAGRGISPFAVGVNERLVALLGVSDKLHPDAPAVVAKLRADGVHVTLLTGDRQGTADAIGKELDLSDVLGERSPEGKADVIRAARAGGAVVAMVGDGINDAVALAAADVGVAMGSGTDVAASLADLTLLAGGIARLPTALELARATLHTIRAGLFWAFAYNVIGIPIAAGLLYPSTGLLLSPVLASAAMSLSSVSVLLNALRLKRFGAR